MPRNVPMSEFMLEEVATRFRALAAPSRLALMNLLWDGERTVGDLVEASGLTPANVSKHLSLLHQAGFVTRRKEGLHVYYALADEDVGALCELMCGRVQAETERNRSLARGRRRARS